MHHQPQREVKVLRYVALGPDLLLVICLVDESRFLHCRPSKEGVVADKRSDVSIGTVDGDALVDTARKISDGILKVVMSDLEDCSKPESAKNRIQQKALKTSSPSLAC